MTIARLKAIAGEDRVGSPILEDKHRPGSFRMEDFAVPASSGTAKTESPRLALRRMRPPVPVSVAMHANRPVRFRDLEHNYEVTAAYGPWRASGCWWSTEGWVGVSRSTRPPSPARACAAARRVLGGVWSSRRRISAAGRTCGLLEHRSANTDVLARRRMTAKVAISAAA